ncbi:hypothetical protein ACOI1H_21555, partial [Loktanella sp. DJP18]|uniref:hypothetical protein n=1 Tax=Loktanella sp. DJP18 TaxID=3409788 RepID=UPI003BB6C539
NQWPDDPGIRISIKRDVSIEIRGPFQSFDEPTTDQGERVAVTVSAEAGSYRVRDKIALPAGSSEAMLEARIQKTLPDLRRLGDN